MLRNKYKDKRIQQTAREHYGHLDFRYFKRPRKNRPNTESSEDALENYLESNIHLISEHLLIIGRQVGTEVGTCIDLLCIDKSGSLVILELKNEMAKRTIISQVLDYLVWVKTINLTRITSIYREYDNNPNNKKMASAFQEKFGIKLPEQLNTLTKCLIIAPDFDIITKKIIFHLAEKDIQLVCYVNKFLFSGTE